MAQKNKPSVVIHPKARERMLDIWSYTHDTWGEKQADKYIDDLNYYMHSLATHHYLWRKVPHENFKDVYYSAYESHFIFFHIFEDKTVGILSILHRSADIPARLLDDIDT